MLFKRGRYGPILWVASIQYFIIQVIVATAYIGGYSWTQNTISDLGNTSCAISGTYATSHSGHGVSPHTKIACSQLYLNMNISFIVLGCTMLSGAFYTRKLFGSGRLITAGFVCLGLAGIGTILVGLYPENTVSALHTMGAALPFVLGNLGTGLLGISLTQLPRPLRIFTIACGTIGLAALTLFLVHTYLDLGPGGMERLTAYPQTIWLIVCGVYLLKYPHRHKLH
jgi:hypothetical membrane protein